MSVTWIQYSPNTVTTDDNRMIVDLAKIRRRPRISGEFHTPQTDAKARETMEILAPHDPVPVFVTRVGSTAIAVGRDATMQSRATSFPAAYVDALDALLGQGTYDFYGASFYEVEPNGVLAVRWRGERSILAVVASNRTDPSQAQVRAALAQRNKAAEAGMRRCDTILRALPLAVQAHILNALTHRA